MDINILNDHMGLPTSQISQMNSEETIDLFTRHTDSVLCCAIDNNSRLAVSGGIDDTAFVWDLNTKHVIFECSGHKESVVAASFSLISTYVATGDLNGYIQVRNTTTGNRVFDFEIDEINWIFWHNTSDYVLLAGTTKGDFWMWNVNDPVAVKTFNSYGSPTTAARLLPDGIKMIVSYQDGSVRMFDLKTKQSIQSYHDPDKAEVISMDLNPKKSIFAVGCIDSKVRLITISTLKVIGTLNCQTPSELHGKQLEQAPEEAPAQLEEGENNEEECDDSTDPSKLQSVEVIDEYTGVKEDVDPQGDEDEESMTESSDEESGDPNSVESVQFSPCGQFVAASNNSGTTCIWDVSTQALRAIKHTGVGVTRAAWTTSGDYVSAHLDGTIRISDNNLVEKLKLIAHEDQILDLALKENLLVTASEDKTVRVTRF